MYEEKAYVNVFNAWNENIKTRQSLCLVGVFRIIFVERDRHVFRQIVNKAKNEKVRSEEKNIFSTSLK